MADRQKIIINKDEQNRAAIANAPGPEGKKGVLFVSGSPKTIAFTELEQVREIKQPDGTIKRNVIPAPVLDFNNCTAYTEDEETIKAAFKHPRFGTEFYVHEKYFSRLPEDEPEWRKDQGRQLTSSGEEHIAEMVKRRDMARQNKKEIKEYHPEEGLIGKVTDENPDPNAISDW